MGLILLFFDFWSKSYVYNVIPFIAKSGQGISLFQNFLGGIDFSISLAFNQGAAWGLLSNFQIPLLIFRISIVFFLLLYLIFFNSNLRLLFPFVFIITGAIGNIIDFFIYGSVVDFFLFTFWGWHFPLFNVADTMITIGVALFFLANIFCKASETKRLYKQ